MIISFDSTRAIAVTKKNDRSSFVKMWDLESYKLTFEEELVGSFIKVKEIEQNDHGTAYACVYFNNGVWFLRTFGKISRTVEQIRKNEININDIFGLDDYTMVNEAFYDPFGGCCFVDD